MEGEDVVELHGKEALLVQRVRGVAVLRSCMRKTVMCRNSAGAALFADTPACRVITLSRPGALNTMTLSMVQDLHRLYLVEPHPNPDAIYVLRGDGRRSFCAGGDVKALTGPGHIDYNPLFYSTEYQVDSYVASRQRTQVALWAGHVLGSGVGISVHGRYRVACETTRFAMPETQIGAANDVATSWLFSSLPIRGLGAYLAITGNALCGADVLHAGLATHYIPLGRFDAAETALAALASPEEVRACLCALSDEVTAPLPPFSLEEDKPVLAKVFGRIKRDTRLQDIMAELLADGSAFARRTWEVMQTNSPLGMTFALENMKRQHTRDCDSVMDAFRADYALIQSPLLFQEFLVGTHARLVAKESHPRWTVSSVAEVDVGLVRRQFQLPDGVCSF